MSVNKNITIFTVRQQYFNNAGVNPKQGGCKEPGRRSDESSQLCFGIVQSCCRSDRSIFQFSVMRQQKSEIGLSANNSSGSSASCQRNEQPTPPNPLSHEVLLDIIDSYFDVSGVGRPCNDMSMLLGCFTATQEDDSAYSVTFMNNISCEVARLNAFLTQLFEERAFLKAKEVQITGISPKYLYRP